ncbi:Zinc-iron permease, partial [Globisporangium splendens]
MEDVTVFKLVSIAAIWLVGLVGGLIPALLASKKQRSARVKYVLSVLNAFSGGVFLAGGFFHLLHSAVENPALQNWSTVDDGRYEFPYAEMFCTLGFLGLLLLEQGAHAQMSSQETYSKAAYAPAKHDDDLDEEYGSRGDASDTYVEEEDEEDEENALRGFSASNKARSPAPHHHSGHSHGHSHLGPAPAGSSLAVAVVLFIALSFHSVLEGLGIGAQTRSAWGVFLAIVVHKGLAAFALGSGLVQSSLKTSHVTLYMVVFSFMSIIGIIIGWIIAADSSEDSAAAGICVALASGTFIYVAVMEVIPQEFPRHTGGDHKPQHTTQKTIALCLGYAIFGMLAKWS